MKTLFVPLRRWHKQYFGDISERMKRFEEELKKVDDMISSERHDARRRNNRIESLVIHKKLVRNQARIKVVIRHFYKRLYHQEASPRVSFRYGLVNRLEKKEAEALEVLPSVEKVKDSVWDCESFKAPGSDGYNMNFIKKCWVDIKTEFTGVVMSFFETERLPVDFNVTWIALAPKFVGAKEIKDLKPISMVPNAVARRIISLQTRFFWGKEDGRPGMALVKWEMIQTPKKLGGLGVGDAEDTLDEELLRFIFTKKI
ncbi:uncharacterized protein LOC107461998 [Arachis duranensis]|uniref:Uncharacterized protein LOC107461998 n=1 Tax=Arachis duranensis TaxID=130453 RepID=A0A6P4C211_ARADU|nr:uncharacterized protein LOC107461998 [Arachis duranensis]